MRIVALQSGRNGHFISVEANGDADISGRQADQRLTEDCHNRQ